MVTVSGQDDVQIITIEGDHLDAGNYKIFKEEMQAWVANGKKTAFDIANVKFIDSSGLGAILSILRDIQKNGGDLRICAPGPAIKILFELVRLQKILDIYETREAALSSWQG